MSYALREVTAAQTVDLRREVLRGGRPVALPGDDEPAYYLAAYDGDELVSTGNVRLDAAPWTAEGPAWRLRGMATAASHRGRGVGALVLGGLLEHCRTSGGRLLWCNARTPAQRFYERHGLQVVGEPWEEPEIGPHVRMWVDL